MDHPLDSTQTSAAQRTAPAGGDHAEPAAEDADDMDMAGANELDEDYKGDAEAEAIPPPAPPGTPMATPAPKKKQDNGQTPADKSRYSGGQTQRGGRGQHGGRGRGGSQSKGRRQRGGSASGDDGGAGSPDQRGQPRGTGRVSPRQRRTKRGSKAGVRDQPGGQPLMKKAVLGEQWARQAAGMAQAGPPGIPPQSALAAPAPEREEDEDLTQEKAKLDAAVSDYQSMIGGLEHVLHAAVDGKTQDFQ